MTPINNVTGAENIFNTDFNQVKDVTNSSSPKDTIEISDSAKVFSNIDKIFDVNNPDRLNLSEMNDAEKKEFLNTVRNLLKKGFMGYETLKVKGKVEKHFIETEIGDERLKGAKVYTKDKSLD